MEIENQQFDINIWTLEVEIRYWFIDLLELKPSNWMRLSRKHMLIEKETKGKAPR